jgi:beta-lactamase class A
MRKDFDTQRINTATPLAATRILKIFYDNKVLSKKGNDFLKKLMTNFYRK